MDKLTLTPAEAVKVLGISLPVFYQLCKTTDFPSFKVGRKILVSEDGLRRWVERQAAGGMADV